MPKNIYMRNSFRIPLRVFGRKFASYIRFTFGIENYKHSVTLVKTNSQQTYYFKVLVSGWNDWYVRNNDEVISGSGAHIQEWYYEWQTIYELPKNGTFITYQTQERKIDNSLYHTSHKQNISEHHAQPFRCFFFFSSFFVFSHICAIAEKRGRNEPQTNGILKSRKYSNNVTTSWYNNQLSTTRTSCTGTRYMWTVNGECYRKQFVLPLEQM